MCVCVGVKEAEAEAEKQHESAASGAKEFGGWSRAETAAYLAQTLNRTQRSRKRQPNQNQHAMKRHKDNTQLSTSRRVRVRVLHTAFISRVYTHAVRIFNIALFLLLACNARQTHMLRALRMRSVRRIRSAYRTNWRDDRFYCGNSVREFPRRTPA